MQLTIQMRLFLGFSFLCSIIVASSGYLYYSQTSDDLMKRVEETNRQQLYRYQEALDNIIEDMDRISAQVIFNSELKSYLSEQIRENDSTYQSLQLRKKFEDMLRSFNGPWFIATQINVITVDGYFLTYGQDMNPIANIKPIIQQAKWIDQALQLGGDKVLVPPHISQWNEMKPLYFSLTRSFNFPKAFPAAVVEVQQPYELLEETMDIGRIEQTGSKVYVINDQGELFYPYYDEHTAAPVIPNWSGDAIEVKRENSREYDIWSQARSEFSGLTVLIQQPKSEVMQPINHLRQITLLLAVAGAVIALVIAYFLSAGITAPIRYLQKRLEKLNIDNVSTASVKKLKRTKEIALLYDTFEEMRERLNLSIHDVLHAQQRENLAHLQAMYAQMNPHFLFNVLTSLASHAEEQGFPEYAQISQKLSSMLRYSTNSLSDSVQLSQEITYALQYMDLMQFRYEGQFTFIIESDSSLQHEPVPKFLLQPLIENSFAHGFQHIRPPWLVEVYIATLPQNDGWEIIIKDNGSGFSDSAYIEAETLIQELNAGQVRELEALSGHGIGKLGIVNTLTRCRLFWNDNVTFSLKQPAKGMEFVITIRRSN